MRVFVLAVVAIVTLTPIPAQQSASFEVDSSELNAGGRPLDGVETTSAAFRVRLDAIGDAFVLGEASSTSYRTGSGFVGRYRPPGEVEGLLFPDDRTLVWSAEPSAGTYNLYRGALGDLGALQFGSCTEQDVAATTTTDGDPLPAGDGYAYLVTVLNRLREEGSKGFGSDGSERLGGVCP